MKFFLAFLALAIALTWPLVLHLDTAAADRGDPLLTAWILDWVGYALTHAPLQLYDAPIYHPARYPLAYSENLIGIAVLMLPLHSAGLSPLTVQNIAILLGFAFSAYGMFVLARLITRHTAASFFAGIVFAFGSFMVAHVQHIQIVWSGWLPLMFAALLAYWREPSTKRAALVGGAFLMSGLTNVYWLMFGAFTMGVTIAFLAAFSQSGDWRRRTPKLLASLAVAGVVLVPILMPYAIVAQEFGSRTTAESRGGSASFINWLVPSSRNAVYGSLADPALHLDERELFPGLLVLFLAGYAVTRLRGYAAAAQPRNRATAQPFLDIAIFASAVLTYLTVVRDRITLGGFAFSGADVPAMLMVVLLIVRFFPQIKNAIHNPERGAAALWIVIGFVASLGWNAFLHPFLFRMFMPFRATRTPARWAVIALMGLAVWAAIGFVALLERTQKKRLVTVLVLALAILEVIPRIRWDHLDPDVAPVYRWLAQTKPRAVLELPMNAHGVPFEYILASSAHRVPILNGSSGWETPQHAFLRKKEEKLEYDDAFLDAAMKNGCELLIVHEQRLTPEQQRALAPLLQKLIPLRRFGSDLVFRAPRAPAGTATAPREAPHR